MQGTRGGHLIQPPCPSRATYSQLFRTTPKYLVSISKDGISTASQDNLCQCFVTLTKQKCFLMFTWSLLFPCVPITSCSGTRISVYSNTV